MNTVLKSSAARQSGNDWFRQASVDGLSPVREDINGCVMWPHGHNIAIHTYIPDQAKRETAEEKRIRSITCMNGLARARRLMWQGKKRDNK